MAAKKFIYEPAAETAKKIRKELKKSYPATKFSVTSSNGMMTSSVDVRYKDGLVPDRKEITAFLKRFSSSWFDGMTDCVNVEGYEYEGKLYSGADYIFYSQI